MFTRTFIPDYSQVDRFKYDSFSDICFFILFMIDGYAFLLNISSLSTVYFLVGQVKMGILGWLNGMKVKEQ